MKNYLLLMRFHKPVGILLLWFPTAWALWIANQGHPPLLLCIWFLLGTVLMRAAGCVVNDIADRHIDLHVSRTNQRPLTSNKVTLIEAILLLLMLLFLALLILVQLPVNCFYYALFAVFITILYPFCKRFIQGPQLILGIAFSMGIPMAFTASYQPVNTAMMCLLLINFLWIVAYDTEYAIADREDDLRIGVKSTAILFASFDKLIIGLLQIAFHGLWLFLAYYQNYTYSFFICWFSSIGILIYQQRLLHKNNSIDSLRAFSSNSWYGLIMWVALILQ